MVHSYLFYICVGDFQHFTSYWLVVICLRFGTTILPGDSRAQASMQNGTFSSAVPGGLSRSRSEGPNGLLAGK